MSFGIELIGRPDGVKKVLEQSQGCGNPTFHDLARTAAIAFLDTIPAEHRDGVIVQISAGGYHDFSPGAGSHIYGNVELKLSIREEAK